jgi:hypothetical protein
LTGVLDPDMAKTVFPAQGKTKRIPPGKGQKNAFQFMKTITAPAFYPQMKIYLTGSFNPAGSSEKPFSPHNPVPYYTEKYTFVKP